MSLDFPDPPQRPRGAGLPPWLEWATSIAALVVGVSSIAIAVRNGHNEDKLVQAASFPYLEIGQSNATPEGAKRLSLGLWNQGVGPAHEQSLTIRVGDHYATSLRDLITTVIGPSQMPEARNVLGGVSNSQRSRFIPAAKSQYIFDIPRTDANARWWDVIDKSRPSWRIDVCYCSVFKDCWVRSDDQEPVPVKACKRDEPHEYN